MRLIQNLKIINSYQRLPSQCLWLLVFPLLLNLNVALTVARAEEKEGSSAHEASKAEGSGEAKAGESGEAGKEGESGEGSSPEFVKKDEYLELNSSIELLSAKVRSKSEALNKLLEEKGRVKDPVEFKKLVQDLESEYRELKETIESLEKKKDVLRYRFPEKSFVKKEEKVKLEPLEEMSGEMIIEKKLDDFLKTVEEKYRLPIRTQAARDKEKRGPASEGDHGENENHPQSPEEFTRSLILKK